MRLPLYPLVVAAFLSVLATPACAQDPTTPPLEVGTVAPDFAIPGATRYGVLREPVRLSNYRGKTVVLAFFYRARSRG